MSRTSQDRSMSSLAASVSARGRRARSRRLYLGLATVLLLPLLASVRPATGWEPVLTAARAAEAEQPQADDPAKISFNRDIRPILSDKCFACHGFDPNHREAGLRLDVPPSEDGVVSIVPGDLAASELWQRVTSLDSDLQMPPPHTHKSLSDAEKELLRRWILEGAVYEGHWAFEPIPARVAVPEISGVAQPIDAFLRQRLAVEGLTASPPADPATLLRRLSFALTGLPPTAEQIAEYLADPSPDAYEKWVDQLLASPHYGEEMARHWLDLARYADTHGMHLDNERQMWAYRDWVIQSFNRNQPFDQFTIEQLAGDLLPTPAQEQLIATGFNRCNVTTGEGGSIDAEWLFRYAVERASTTAEAWLGLTAGCAACHDHKFDPISQAEFYSLYAFFYSAADPAMDGNALLTAPVMRIESPGYNEKKDELQQSLQQARAALLQQASALVYSDPAEQTPPLAATFIEQWWLDDDFPAGGRTSASPGHPTELIATAAPQPTPVSGEKLLRRRDAGLAQDVWETEGTPLTLPTQAKFVAHVYLEPADLPQAIMVQFNKGGWKHRAVWGNYEIIDWGAKGTNERVAMGDLPAAGAWVRLEFPVTTVGLQPGDAVSGFALTQHGGTVYWDQVGVVGESNPATDPAQSFVAWWTQVQQDPGRLPNELREVAKQGPNAERNSADAQALKLHYLTQHCQTVAAELGPAKQAVAALEQQQRELEASLPSTFIFRDLDQPRPTYVMLRGQYNQPGDEVHPAVPAVLPPLVPGDGRTRANRLDLARWLVAPENPLTARVAVNRFWQQLVGSGLVRTPADFGSQGEPPSHPELLDWLAREFQESGWDVKSLVRRIVTSDTFRQRSAVTPELLERDPENRVLARMTRPRLAAEQVRDNVLMVSGLLVPDMGGKGVKPYQPDKIWEPVGFVGSNTQYYSQDKGSALYRRSIYTFLKRTAPPPFMSNFDAPNREQSCSGRGRSNTPLQALQLMNDVQHVEAARVLATKVLTTGGDSPVERLQFATTTVLARPATDHELQILQRQLQQHHTRYTTDTAAAGQLVAMGESPVDASLDVAELAAYTLLCATLLNLDETLTRN